MDNIYLFDTTEWGPYSTSWDSTAWDSTAEVVQINIYNQDEERQIIIFGTQQKLGKLWMCPSWYVDATFKPSPQLFYQILSILKLVYLVLLL